MLENFEKLNPNQVEKYQDEVMDYLSRGYARLGILDISNIIHKYFYTMYTKNGEIYEEYSNLLDELGIKFESMKMYNILDIENYLCENLDNFKDIQNNIYKKVYYMSYQEKLENICEYILLDVDKYIMFYYMSHFVIAWDSPDVEKIRVIEDETYKTNRKDKPIGFTNLKNTLYKMILKRNYPIIDSNEYEADDVINSVVKKYYKDFNKIYVITLDKDLYCLFENRKVSILDINTNKLIKSKEEVKHKIGFYPEEIDLVLTLKGDATDGIKGVANIGVARVNEILEHYTTYEELFLDITKYKKLKEKGLYNSLGETNISKKLNQQIINWLLDDYDSFISSHKLVRLKLMNINKKVEDFSIIDKL